MAERIFVRKLGDDLWQWRHWGNDGAWQGQAFYTGDSNLLAESINGQTVTLILPGDQVVSQYLEMDVSDKKLVSKLAPFELEENIIDPVEELVFAYSPFVDNGVFVSYVQQDYAQGLIESLESLGADVSSCCVDYLELEHQVGQWTLILDNETVIANTGEYQGFVIEKALAALYLESLFKEALPTSLDLIAVDDAALDQLEGLLPKDVTENEDIDINDCEGSYWDFLQVNAKPSIEFRAGALARKLPFKQWWEQWQVPAIAAVIAFMVAVGTSWWEVKEGKAERKRLIAERNELFRQVVPRGSISDPVRQLKKLLGSDNSTEPSRVMMMMEKISKPINTIAAGQGNIKLSSFRYNHDKRLLQINLEAKNFALFEQLQSKIVESGLSVDIKGANKSGDVHQAQMRISDAKS